MSESISRTVTGDPDPAEQPTVPAPPAPEALRTDEPATLTFPDLPRLELDQLLGQLVERATEVMSAQGRLRGLLRANQAIVADLTLAAVLRHVVEAARDLLDARYAALGVLDQTGGLAEFIHVGMPDDAVAEVGHLPTGKGLLGALIDDPRPISLDRIDTDPRSSGFPATHPPMTSFLGVPIKIRDEVFGNLYLTDSAHGRFTAEDTELARALAATAAVAIDNARNFESTRRRGEWLAATGTIARQMLTRSGRRPLRTIAEHARRLADAELVAILVPDDDRDVLRVEAAVGSGETQLAAARLIGRRGPVDGSLCAHVFTTAVPLRLGAPSDRPELPPSIIAEEIDAGPMLVVPLSGSTATNGVLAVLRRRGREPFSAEDLDMAAGFANQASVALELAQARAEQERAGMLEERQRIAADLHDHVIQRLFAAGLTLHGLAARLGSDDLSRQLVGVVDSLDDTISQIRTSIFALQRTDEQTTAGPRAEILEVVEDAAGALGFTPNLRFSGPIGTLLRTAVRAEPQEGAGSAPTVAEDLVAVLREALSNAARHSGATSVDVDVTARDDVGGRGAEVTLEVRDNGVGIGPTSRRSGLENLRARAERHGGTFIVAPVGPTGTCLSWTVPLR